MTNNNKIVAVIATLALVVALGVAMFKGGEIQLSDSQLNRLVSAIENATGMEFGATGTRFPNGLSTDSTSPAAGEVRTALLTATATTTFTQSVDGMMIGGVVSFSATGTPVTVYTNTTGPKYCDARTGYLIERNGGVFVPGHEWSVGTSTASAVATTNLLASSTIFATTTPGTVVNYLASLTGKFFLGNGETLTAIMDAKINNLDASSTNLISTKMRVEVGVWCQDLSV